MNNQRNTRKSTMTESQSDPLEQPELADDASAQGRLHGTLRLLRLASKSPATPRHHDYQANRRRSGLRGDAAARTGAILPRHLGRCSHRRSSWASKARGYKVTQHSGGKTYSSSHETQHGMSTLTKRDDISNDQLNDTHTAQTVRFALWSLRL